MKKVLLTVLILIIGFTSCSKEEDLNNGLIKSELVGVETNRKNAKSNSGFAASNTNLLENKMQWFSYITTEVLMTSYEARQEFQAILNSSSTANVIKLSALLSSGANNTNFMSVFESKFDFYQYSNQEDGTVRPNERPRPGTGGGPGLAPGSSEFELYLSSLLYEDCLELYLPNGFISFGLNSNDITSILSSAHPLSSDDHNDEAYLFLNTYAETKTSVNENTSGNIIITRPYKNRGNCLYLDYINIDFTDFLAN
ncbi:hypothetical protein [Tenacibaculum sp. 190524A05c]|uniref:hypothetical protein n=1 Tax=Tenacibaculum platacis TaxID=3137852 RepID=UPI0031FB8762